MCHPFLIDQDLATLLEILKPMTLYVSFQAPYYLEIFLGIVGLARLRTPGKGALSKGL